MLQQYSGPFRVFKRLPARPLPTMCLLHGEAGVLCTELGGQQGELARGVVLVRAAWVRAGASRRHPVTHTHTAAVTQSGMQAPTKKWKMSGAVGRLWRPQAAARQQHWPGSSQLSGERSACDTSLALALIALRDKSTYYYYCRPRSHGGGSEQILNIMSNRARLP